MSLNFLRTDLSVRSYFQFTEQELNNVYQDLKGKDGLLGLLIISTCNRTEVYIDHENSYDITTLLQYLQEVKQTQVPLSQFEIIGDPKNTVKYIVEVANGLHSLVIGDKQILSQFKRAFNISQQNNFINGVMERVFQVIFRSHKRISNETNYHKGSKSISHLAVYEVNRKFRDKNIPILVIGAGEIAADLLKYFSTQSFTNITVINRTMIKAQLLANRYDYVSADYNIYPGFLNQFQAIISCAAAENILNAASLKDVTNKLFIDLTTFSSIILPHSDSSNRLLTLDDFAHLRDSAYKDQVSAVESVSHIISDELTIFFNWMTKRESFKQSNKFITAQ
ncbi:MAG: hypothetical protein JWQ54_1498 [Mucilaginibacter sp.]|nr:hypothetical protein [Mucilaginibacter sp.]